MFFLYKTWAIIFKGFESISCLSQTYQNVNKTNWIKSSGDIKPRILLLELIILQLFTINYDHFVKTFIAHDGDKFTLPFSLLLRPVNKGEHGFYPVNSQTESIGTGVKCRELKFLININIFRALCRETRWRIRRKDGYVALP